MKNRLLIFALLAAFLLPCCGGGGEDPIVDPVAEPLIDTTIIFSPYEGKELVHILSRASWKATVVEGAAWCSVNPSSAGSGGATVAVKVKENDEFLVRTARIEFKSSLAEGVINVIQQQIDVLDLTVDDSCEFGPNGGMFAVGIDYNVDYTVTCDAGWVRETATRAPHHQTKDFTVDKNATGEPRECHVQFAGAGMTRTVTVYQDAAYIALSLENITLGDGDTYLPMMAESNISYSLTLPEAEWFSYDGETSAGSDGRASSTRFAFNFEENLTRYWRECEVVFSNPDYNASETLRIIHKSPDILFASTPLLDFGPDGGSYDFDIDADMEYTFSVGDASWITVSGVADNPRRRVITVAKNESGGERSGAVTITRGSRSKTLDVMQGAAKLVFSQDKITFGTLGGDASLTVTGNVAFRAVLPTDAPWCTIEETAPGEYSISATRNDLETSRECTLTFVNDTYQLSCPVVISQAQKDAFDVTPQQFSVGPEGGPVELNVHSNVPFEHTPDADWLTEAGEPAAQDHDYSIVYQVPLNSAKEPRQGHIAFTGEGVDATVTISQAAAVITASQREFTFDDAAAEGSFTVSGNVDYKVLNLADEWLTLNAEADRVALEENNEWGNRSGQLILCNELYEAADTVSIFQGAKYYLDIEQSEFNLGPQGGTVTVKATSNKEYQYHIADAPDWIAEASALVFNIAPNTGSQAREAEIVFEQNGMHKSVIITQDAPFLNCSPDRLEYSAVGGTATFSVASNVAFTVGAPSEDWAECAPDGLSAYKVSVAANEITEMRECTIAVAASDFGLSTAVTIHQKEKGIFELAEQEFELGPVGGEIAMEINTNVDYSFEIEGDWIEPLGEDKFAIAKNMTDESRSGVITYSANGYTYPVTVLQQAPFITVNPARLEFPVDGGSQRFIVSSNVDFGLSLPDEEWLGCTAGASGAYTATAKSNEVEQAREAVIHIVSEAFELDKELVVWQNRSDFFEINVTEIDAAPVKSVIEVPVATNMEYEVSVGAFWIEDIGENKFTVYTNTTSQAREGVIEYTVGDDVYRVTVKQAAPALTVSNKSFALDSLGGQISVVVDANVPYELEMPAAGWLACTDTIDSNKYVFEVAENTTYKTRNCRFSFTSEDFGLSCAVSVSQTGRKEYVPFALDERDYFAGPTGGRLIISHMECKDVAITSAISPWLHELPELHTDTQKVFYLDTLYTSSTRQAAISLTGNGRTVTAYIFQNPPMTIPQEREASISGNGGSVSITVVANYYPKLYPGADWISGTVEMDGEFYKATFSAEANQTGEDRSAVVGIGLQELNYIQEVTISQKAGDRFNIDPELLVVGNEGGEFYVTVDSNVSSISISPGPSWVTCYATEDGSALVVKVSKNTSASDRSTSFRLSGGVVTKYLDIRQEGYRNPDYYYSTDFSQDGVAVQLQQATEGSGIPLVLMGDAFTDRLIADGTYAATMERTVEKLFAIEPYKSFKNLFDIWYINVVSLNDVYADDASTALSTSYVKGSLVTGDHTTVRNLALNLLDPVKIKYAGIVVIMNNTKYGGTTYMHYILQQQSGATDYGAGESIAYVPLCPNDSYFTTVVQHEVGGHCLGKLEDEYYSEENGEIPASEIEKYNIYQPAGYYKNVDFTSDPEAVRWAKFLTDERYQYDGLGVLEGACSYPRGAYRSSDDSIMYHDSDRFSAPGREAIYYRLHKIAYGSAWAYDFEDFVEYDAVNRKSAPSGSPSASPAGRSKRTSTASEHIATLPSPIIIRE